MDNWVHQNRNYSNNFTRVRDILTNSEKFLDTNVNVRGRVVSVRKLGKISFADMLDEGYKIQLLIRDDLNSQFVNCVNTGDIIDVNGILSLNNHNTVELHEFHVIKRTKDIFPKFLDNKHKRYQKRYLDITINEKSRNIITLNSQLNKSIRKFLWENQVEEFPTPILSSKFNGGASVPFKTDIRSINKTGYLRVTSEIYLKQLLASGYLSIFEIGKQFRNAGMDKMHLPEFQMLEIYRAYHSSEDMLELVLNLIERLLTELYGKPIIYDDEEAIPCSINDWEMVNAYEKIKNETGINLFSDLENLRKEAIKLGINCDKDSNYSTVVGNIIDRVIRENSRKPTIVHGLPSGMTPLMKSKVNEPNFLDRYWLFLKEVDFCDIGSEQNDYELQEKALKEQYQQLKETRPNLSINDDILKVVSFGLPPIGGVGLSISRLIMIIAGTNDIRETNTFPLY